MRPLNPGDFANLNCSQLKQSSLFTFSTGGNSDWQNHPDLKVSFRPFPACVSQRKAFSVAVLRNARALLRGQIRKARQTKFGEIGPVALQVEANYLIAG